MGQGFTYNAPMRLEPVGAVNNLCALLKVDPGFTRGNVRFWRKADIGQTGSNDRFGGTADIQMEENARRRQGAVARAVAVILVNLGGTHG